MVTTITITKKEYHELTEKALRYEYIYEGIKENIFAPPPTKNVEKIIKEFGKTGQYTQKFLKSLEKGLKRSSYFRV